MSHRCLIEGSSTACFEDSGELWVKEYGDGCEKEGRTYRVNFCPECGFKPPKKDLFNFLHFPYQEPEESISRFSSDLSRAIAQMNYNVELIKSFMSTQITQNQCFLDRDLQVSQKIDELERRINVLEKD